MNYWVFKANKLPDGVKLSSEPEGGPDGHMYNKGVPLAEGYPDEAVMCFDPNFPDDHKVYDILACLGGDRIVLNEQAREVLENCGAENLEFLPVLLWDHQDRPVPGAYFILNVLGAEKAIDMEKSRYRMNSFFPDRIKKINELHLDHPNIPENAKIFRLEGMRNTVVINDNVKNALESAAIQGWKAYKADGWDGVEV